MEATIINKFGKMIGWNAITVNILGRDLEGITQVAYDDTVAKDNAYGAGKMPIGRTEGNYVATASITLKKEEAIALQQSLGVGRRIQDIAPFDMVIQYENRNGVITLDRVRNCEFTNNGVDVSQSDGSIDTQYTLLPSHIDWNTI